MKKFKKISSFFLILLLFSLSYSNTNTFTIKDSTIINIPDVNLKIAICNKLGNTEITSSNYKNYNVPKKDL